MIAKTIATILARKDRERGANRIAIIEEEGARGEGEPEGKSEGGVGGCAPPLWCGRWVGSRSAIYFPIQISI